MYFLLLTLTALFAYILGSLSTTVIASNFLFHTNLKRLGTGNYAISEFRRRYGVKGIIKIALVEVIKSLLAVLIGGWLLGIKEQALVGRAFAGFCLIMGRQWPLFSELRGSRATVCLIIMAMCLDFGTGLAVLVIVGALIWFTRYITVSTLIGAFVLVFAAILVMDSRLVTLLCLFTFIVMLAHSLPCISRMINGKEEKLDFTQDLNYKFDQKF